MFKIDERVGCIAVVESSFTGNCLYAEMDGVVAFWSGVRGDNGWEVLEWQKEKASQLCNLLNGQAAEQGVEPTVENDEPLPRDMNLKVRTKLL